MDVPRLQIYRDVLVGIILRQLRIVLVAKHSLSMHKKLQQLNSLQLLYKDLQMYQLTLQHYNFLIQCRPV